MEKSTITVKGQVVIPVKLRRKMGLKKGMRVFVEEKNGDIILHPIMPDFYERMQGIFKGKDLVKTLEESRRRDKEREDKKWRN